MTDSEIVCRVRAGETEVFSELVERYRNATYALTRFYLKNRDDALDATQQALLDAFQRLDQLRDPARFGPWLRHIALSRCRMSQRRKATVSLETLETIGCSSMQPVEMRLVVEQALACLSEASRLTLTLFYLRSYSLEEIAVFLEVPVTTVKSRLRNARTRLRKELWDMVEETVQVAPLPEDFVQQVMARVHGGGVLCVTFSSDGTRVVSGSSDTTLKIWDARSGALLMTLSGHTRAVDEVAFSPDGCLIASASRDRTIRLWDAQTGEMRATVTDHGRSYSLAFVGEGRALAHVSAWFGPNYQIVLSRAVVRDTETGRLLREIDILPWHIPEKVSAESPSRQHGMMTCITGSPDGKQFATSHSVAEGDRFVGGEVTLWNADSGAVLRTLALPDAMIKSVAFSPDGQTLAGACTRLVNERTSEGEASLPSASYIQLWHTDSGEPLRILAESEESVAQQVLFSPVGRTLALYRLKSEENQASLYDWQTGEERHTFSQAGRHQASIAFSPDGTTLVSGAGDALVLWKIR